MSRKLKALALALIMILSLIPYVNASSVMALETITDLSDLSITVHGFEAGNIPPSLDGAVTLPEHVTLESTAYQRLFYKTPGGSVAWLIVQNDDVIFSDGVYYLYMNLKADEGYEFDLPKDSVVVTLNGETTTVKRHMCIYKGKDTLDLYVPILGSEDVEAHSITFKSGVDGVDDVVYAKYFLPTYKLPSPAPGDILWPFKSIDKEQSDFEGWEVDGEKKNAGTEINVNKDLTLTAKWKGEDTPQPPAEDKVTVSFDGNGGTETMEDVSVTKGTEYSLPECGFTAPTDKEFKAWEVAGEEKAVGDKITVNADTTVKALWKDKTPAAEQDYVTLTFVANEGTFADGTQVKVYQNVEAGSKFKIPDGPVRQGYKFLYWEGSKYYPGDEYTVTHEDHTFTAIWEAETITILPGANGSAGSQTLELPLFREASSNPVARSANQIMSSQTNAATVVTQPSANNAIAGRAAVAQLPRTGESGMNMIAGSLALILAGLFISIRKNMR